MLNGISASDETGCLDDFVTIPICVKIQDREQGLLRGPVSLAAFIAQSPSTKRCRGGRCPRRAEGDTSVAAQAIAYVRRLGSWLGQDCHIRQGQTGFNHGPA